MAGTKSQQNPKVQQQGKTKEKITLNLEELNKLIQKSAPRHNDNIIFEINFFILALTSITFQYLHIYRFVRNKHIFNEKIELLSLRFQTIHLFSFDVFKKGPLEAKAR
jgi:hypothetical protein